MRDLEEEEAAEANTIEPNVCSLADNSYHSIFFSVNYEMALRDFGSMGKKQEVP